MNPCTLLRRTSAASACAVALTILFAGTPIAALAVDNPGQDRPLAAVVDFALQPVGELAPYSDWNWSIEQKAQASSFSKRAIVPNPAGEGHVLRVELSPEFPWRTGPERMHSLTTAYFPPESDAIVLRAKVVSGSFTLAVGGPTAYFGDSDVMTSPQRIESGEWVDIRCDLNDGLCRNFRRAGFSRAATAIAYNRWSQEPPGLYVLPGSVGVLLLQSATLVASGRGHPFPSFDPSHVTSARSVPTAIDRAFTLLMADSQGADFERSWRTPGTCQYAPPRFSETPAPTRAGKPALATTVRWLEEIRWAGVRSEPTPAVNAVRLTVRVTPATPATQLTSDAGQPVDIALLGGAVDVPFPWTRLGPPDEWRQASGVRGYDINLSNRAVAPAEDLHVALYQARRFVRTQAWQTLVIPFEDFACVGATGRLKEHLALHAAPSPDSVAVAGVAWLLPWPRGGRAGETTLEVADVELVTISADETTSRRSYSPAQASTFAPIPGLTGYGGWHQSHAAP